MSKDGQNPIERLQEIMTALMEMLLSESLDKVESAIGDWRAEKLSVFEAHSELLRHAAKAERLVERTSTVGLNNAGALLRDAFDAGLIERDEFIAFVGKSPEDVSASPPLSDEPGTGMGMPNKRALVEELLSEGPVLIHIDARHPLSQVPERFTDDPKLVLRFGYDLTPAIVDLSIDNDGIYGTLTFGGVPFRCVLPWLCIYSVVSEGDQKGMVWPEDVPDVVVEALQGIVDEDDEQDLDSPVALPSPILASVDTISPSDDGPKPPPPKASPP
ncbi:MAG: hypothetical protein JKY56_16655, partial [Kofleriaceae bacterium]|nr:hypothetical protein [Kofleriaceae bacterium]